MRAELCVRNYEYVKKPGHPGFLTRAHQRRSSLVVSNVATVSSGAVALLLERDARAEYFIRV